MSPACAILAIVALGAGPARAEPPLYLADSTFNGQLTRIFRVDTATGDLHLVADLGEAYTPVFGLAAANTAVLYAVGTDGRCGDDTACLLIRMVVDPSGLAPPEIDEIGVVETGSQSLGGISGLTFGRDGWLSAMSQTTDAYYRIDPVTAQASLVGPSGFDQHGGDLTLDASSFHLAWSNIGSQSGLYALDPATGSVTAFALQPNVTLSGLAGIGHGAILHGADLAEDVLREYDALYGPAPPPPSERDGPAPPVRSP